MIEIIGGVLVVLGIFTLLEELIRKRVFRELTNTVQRRIIFSFVYAGIIAIFALVGFHLNIE